MLPKIAIPTFFVKLPVSGKELECRPYLVKEDKILMMAAQANKISDIAMATRQIINACVMEAGFDVKNLSNIDADFLLMNLRSKSVGEVAKASFTCTKIFEEKECNTPFEIDIDLRKVKLEKALEKTKKIEITPDIGIVLKPTTFETTLHYNPDDTEIDMNITSLYYSLDNVYTKDTVLTSKDFTLDEFKNWILDLDKITYGKMVQYLNDLPDMTFETKHTCTKCGSEHEIKLTGLLDFFI